MTYGILETRDHDKIRELILNSKETTFVHKSIEKTQKYLNFWVFSIDLCTKVLFLDFKILSGNTPTTAPSKNL